MKKKRVTDEEKQVKQIKEKMKEKKKVKSQNMISNRKLFTGKDGNEKKWES